MNKETALVAVIALLIGGIAGYALRGEGGFGFRWQNEKGGWYENMPMGMQGMMYGGGDADDFGGMGHMMDMVVGSERELLEQMIPHHQEAVDTAKEVIERGGTTPEIQTLVENIVTAQEREIADMKRWYEQWYGVPYEATGTYQPMMRELADLSGAALDRAFLSNMIMHHMGAIMMARSVEPYIEHSEIQGLTESIIRTQSVEIVQMQQMLQGF